MSFGAKPKKGRPISKIAYRSAIQRTSPLRQNSKIPNHTQSLFSTKPTSICPPLEATAADVDAGDIGDDDDVDSDS